MVLNTKTRRITITNFCLGKHLNGDKDLLRDQRGSPAYISPDVLSGRPYLGKPSDMWALGVLLYTMLYGQFPFYDNTPHELFRKIKAVEYTIPEDGRVSPATIALIRGLLTLDPKVRLPAEQVLDKLRVIISSWRNPQEPSTSLQVVPDADDIVTDSTSSNAASCVVSGELSEFEKSLLRAYSTDSEAVIQASTPQHSLYTPCQTHQSMSIVHLGVDARQLTQAEVLEHLHFLPTAQQ
jgi:serine/threonine-protein kinase 40